MQFLALLVVLAITYVVLLFSKEKLKRHLGLKHEQKKIDIIETRFVPKIGHVCLLSISKKEFLIVSSASGVAISPLSELPEENVKLD
jgi:hypothetical protein